MVRAPMVAVVVMALCSAASVALAGQAPVESTIVIVDPTSQTQAADEPWMADPNPTRLFLAPTARALKRGEAYFGLYEVAVPFVQVGVTDRISIGAGTPLIYFGPKSDRPVWFTPKIQVVGTPSLQASVGVLHVVNIDQFSMGIAYGVVTKGSADSAFTVGAGYAYARGHNGDNTGSAPVLMLGGEHRVSRRIKLVTENYVFHDFGLLSGGVRILNRKVSVDLGLASPIGMGVLVPGLVLNLVRKF
jgi:hypothetical protein